MPTVDDIHRRQPGLCRYARHGFDQIKEFNKHVGGFGHLLMMAQGGHISHADTVANLKLFSKEVLPRLKELQ